MILVDTSVWVDHLRAGNSRLAELLRAGQVACHALVIAEVGLGSLRARSLVLGLLEGLPALPEAEVREVRQMIEARALFGRGIGFVDAALLSSCLIAQGTRLWTRDKRLDAVAREVGVGAGLA